MPILNPILFPFPANYIGPSYPGPFPSPWPPGTKPVQQSPVNNLSFNQQLRQYLISGATIAEVVVNSINNLGGADLTNVKVVSISFDSVTFAPAGSFGGGLITVRLEDIVAIESV